VTHRQGISADFIEPGPDPRSAPWSLFVDRRWALILHRVSKNVSPLARYNFDTCEWILIFFGRNIADKVSSQKHFTMPHQITCASALPGKTGKRENCIFPQMLYYSASSEFNLLLDFFNLFESRRILTLLYDSL